MNLHGDARLSPASRELLCRRVRNDGWTVAEAAFAAKLGMAVSTVCAVLARLGWNRLSKLEPAVPDWLVVRRATR